MGGVRSNGIVLGIVGAGVMGRGIAQVAVLAGIRVLIHDSRVGAAGQAVDQLAGTLHTLQKKGRLEATAVETALERVHGVDALQALAPCQVVVEAIVEDLDAKRRVMRELESVVTDAAVLATNTSSLSVTEIAAGARLPGRIAGMHFFNPVPLMRLVEVVRGERTQPEVADFLVELAERFGHKPVRARDTPGFIVNHAGRGYGPEALRILTEGVASVETIDAVLRGAAGFRMGPFELFDLTGLDVSHPATEAIYRQYYGEPRYQPSNAAGRRVAAGLLGRKTGRGFYSYEDAAPPPASGVPVASSANSQLSSVWLSPRAEAVRPIVTAAGAVLETGDRPSPQALCVLAPLGMDASAAAAELGLDGSRCVAVDVLFGLDTCRTLMATVATSSDTLAEAYALFTADGIQCHVISDSAGFVCQRVVAMLVNISCDMAQQRIAAPQDIDDSVVLGLGHPRGPLSWGDAVGPTVMLSVLEALHATTGEARYRPSPWLRRRAQLGQSLRHIEPSSIWRRI